MGNDDFVRVPKEPHPVAIQAIFDATKLTTLECIAAYRAVVSAAPPAASEAPISAEAVESNDVAEMVDELGGSIDDVAKVLIELSQEARTPGEHDFLYAAASLLQSLAHERERLREHLRQLVLLAEDSGRKNWAIVISARSALPHPDTKGT